MYVCLSVCLSVFVYLSRRNVRRNSKPLEVQLTLNDSKVKSFATLRTVNCVEPVYDLGCGLVIADDPRYTKPRRARDQIQESHLLRTDDIIGANAQTKEVCLQIIPAARRREYRNTNFLGDIAGSGADSIRPGITTLRTTNPLNPAYASLDGGGEILKAPLQPLIPETLVTVPTHFKGSKVVAPVSSLVGSAASRRAKSELDAEIKAVREL